MSKKNKLIKKDNIVLNMSLESYKKKYKRRNDHLLSYTSEQVEEFDKIYNHYTYNGKNYDLKHNKNYLLRNKKWYLIDGKYYELPKPPRLTWFRNLHAAAQVGLCLLGGGVIGISAALPSIIAEINSPVSIKSKEVTFSGGITPSGSFEGIITPKQESKEVVEIEVKCGDTPLSEEKGEFTYDKITGEVKISKEVLEAHPGKINITPKFEDRVKSHIDPTVDPQTSPNVKKIEVQSEGYSDKPIKVTAQAEDHYEVKEIIVYKKGTEPKEIVGTIQGGSGEFIMPKGEVEFEVKTDLIQYKINYVLNGGENDPENPKEYNFKSADITLKDATREGYEFKGWFDNSGFSGEAITKIATGSSGNKTLYAKFEIITYTINLNQGSNITKLEFTGTPQIGETISFVCEAKLGYDAPTVVVTNDTTHEEIKVTDNTFKMPASNVTIAATTAITNYTITYNLNGGTNNPSNPATYTVETDTITLGDPSKDGYDFKGWYAEPEFSTQVTEIAKGSTGNKVLYAKWEIHTYDITIDKGDNIAELSCSGTQQIGNTITISCTPSTGYNTPEFTVTNLTTQETITVTNNTFTMPGADVKVHAECHTLNKHTITLNAGDAKNAKFDKEKLEGVEYTTNVTTYIGANATLTSDDGDLKGYSLNGGTSLIESSYTMPDENISITAVWKKYNFEFVNGEHGTITESTISNAISIDATPITETAATATADTGYHFANQFDVFIGDSATKSETIDVSDDCFCRPGKYATGKPDDGANIKLKPVFEINTYLVSFNPDGGSVTGGTAYETVNYNSLATDAVKGRSATHSERKFKGWSKDGTSVISSETITENTTLIALYNKYNIEVSATTGGSIKGTSSFSNVYGVRFDDIKPVADTNYHIARYEYSTDSGFASATTTTLPFNPGALDIAEGTVYLRVVFELDSVNVIFDANGGSWGTEYEKTVSVSYGSKWSEVSKPTDPTLTGKTFKKWTHTDGSDIDGNETITSSFFVIAQYE